MSRLSISTPGICLGRPSMASTPIRRSPPAVLAKEDTVATNGTTSLFAVPGISSLYSIVFPSRTSLAINARRAATSTCSIGTDIMAIFRSEQMMLQLSDVQWTCDRVLALNPGRQRGRAVAQLPAGYELGGRGRYVTLPCASVGVRLGVGARRSCTMGLVRPGPKGRCSVDPYPLLIGAG